MNNKENEYKIIKFTDGDLELDVRFSIDGTTVYLNQRQLCELYNSSKTSVSEHIKKIIETDGLDETLTVRIFRTLAESGRCYKVKYYNLDIILAVGYRIKSNRINKFNDWAKEKLKEIKNELIIQNPFNYANNYEIVKFESGSISVDVNVSPNEDTVWLTQNDMANLFDTTKQNISNHILNIFSDLEQEKDSVVKKSFTTASDGKTYNVEYYNLDMVLSVGYRVNSKRGIEFRRWANKVLKEYLLKGYSINKKRCLEHSDIILNLNNDVNNLKTKIEKIEKDNLSIKNDHKTLMENFINPNMYKHYLIKNGERVEADVAYQEIYKLAKSSIYIIDDYIDVKTLKLLKCCNSNINIIIITDNKGRNSLSNDFINDFKNDTNFNISIKRNNEMFHDRYIVLDFNTSDYTLYHCGASSKDSGKRINTIYEIREKELYISTIDKALNNDELKIKKLQL